jgi:hypothetical protein
LADVTLNGNGMWTFDPANKMWDGCYTPFMESLHDQVMIQNPKTLSFELFALQPSPISHQSSPIIHRPPSFIFIPQVLALVAISSTIHV